MSVARRPRASTEAKRTRLLDATEEIMLHEGYATVSSRSVAAAAGTNPPSVHYHFPTLDDLFVAVLRRRADHNVRRMAQNRRTPATHVVDIFFAIDVPNPGTLRPVYEERFPTDIPKRPDRRVYAAGNSFLRPGKQIGRARVHAAEHIVE